MAFNLHLKFKNQFIVIFYIYQIVKTNRSISTDMDMDDFIGKNNAALLLISKTSDLVENKVGELVKYVLYVI